MDAKQRQKIIDERMASLSKSSDNKMVELNKPTVDEETPKVKSTNSTYRSVTNLFTNLYQQKFGELPGGNRKKTEDELTTFKERHQLDDEDLFNWVTLLVETVLNDKFKGGYGAIVSDKVISNHKATLNRSVAAKAGDPKSDVWKKEAERTGGEQIPSDNESKEKYYTGRPKEFIMNPANADLLTDYEKEIKAIIDSF